MLNNVINSYIIADRWNVRQISGGKNVTITNRCEASRKQKRPSRVGP